jgi:serine/threonine protein kinase
MMDVPASEHPADDLLRSYGNGRLDETIAEAIGAHVDACPECLARVARLASDSFVGKVRRAHGGKLQASATLGARDSGTLLNQTGTDVAQSNVPPPELAALIDYQIVRKLDEGGMGVIYLARNVLMDRDEVLKVMVAKLIERPGALERFQSEIRVAARMRHPNIVTAYRAFRAGNHLIFAMEYVEGTDLAKIVKSRMASGKGPLPVSNACYYIFQAALALQHAHEQGTVHRDMKPANLMLALKEGQPVIKVLDFGLSKATFENTVLEPERPTKNLLVHTDGGLTIVGHMLGTPEYVAPEQIADAQNADIRADIYSLGCTLYFLLSGRPPFRAQTLWDMLNAHKSRSAERLNFVRTEIPTDLGALVAKMMAKEPARRFQTPAEVASALEPFFKKQAEPAPAPAPVMPPVPEPPAADRSEVVAEEPKPDEGATKEQPAPAIAPRRRAWTWLTAGVSSIIVGAAVLALVMIRPTEKPASLPVPPSLPHPSVVDPEDSDEWHLWRLSMLLELPVPMPFEDEPNPLEPDETPSDLGPIVVRRSSRGLEVARAIRDGVRFLKQQQRADGSWSDVNQQARTGTTSLVTLALLTAGEKPDSPAARRALDYLHRFGPNDLRSTYAISLQTMVFAAVDPDRNAERIGANVEWLQAAQIGKARNRNWWGFWTYTEVKQGGDNSNSQYALLGLNAAAEAGYPVKPQVWAWARAYWEAAQRSDGGWGYHVDDQLSTSSMTCAGISSLVIANQWSVRERMESLQGPLIRRCGEEVADRPLQRGIDWLAKNFNVGQNFPMGQQWKLYYLYGLERAGRLAGVRWFGEHDWYQAGAYELVITQNRLTGNWQGVSENPIVATSFALLFLSKGRTLILIYKLSHDPKNDWNNDPDDVRNLVEIVSRDWKAPLTWRIADPSFAKLVDLVQAPLVFLNGHRPPEFTPEAKVNLREYVDQGGTILADACCGEKAFDAGFRRLMAELFPEAKFKPLPKDHPVWRAKHLLNPDTYPLWGLEREGRTVVIYSPKDLSCYWNQARRSPENPDVILAWKLGQNIVEYATGGETPLDPLMEREVRRLDPRFVAGHRPPAKPEPKTTSEPSRSVPLR